MTWVLSAEKLEALGVNFDEVLGKFGGFYAGADTHTWEHRKHWQKWSDLFISIKCKKCGALAEINMIQKGGSLILYEAWWVRSHDNEADGWLGYYDRPALRDDIMQIPTCSEVIMKKALL